MIIDDFDDIRPYNDSEIPAAMLRIAEDPLLQKVTEFVMPDIPFHQVQELFRSLKTTDEFQHKVMYNAINAIAAKSTSGVTFDGFDNIDPNKRYLFVANHRDIVLDSAFLQLGLVNHHLRTTEITFGSNLMKPQFVVDLGKSNKMFKVERAASLRQFLECSRVLSHYMRGKIERSEESVWIAQRSGRTKNGFDATDQGIIKMFAMSGDNDVLASIARLNILPISISYQIEPCDSLKAHELYVSQSGKYVKSPMEDLDSIITGIVQPKGKVHLQIMPCINNQLAQLEGLTKNDLYKAIAQIIDHSIYKGFRLFNNNFIASDLLHRTHKFTQQYTEVDKETFVTNMNHKLAMLPTHNSEVERLYLSIYAAPVDNNLIPHPVAVHFKQNMR